MSKTSPKNLAETLSMTGKPKASGKGRKRQVAAKPQPKSTRITTLLTRPGGATIAELMKLTGWQAHSVRGFLSGALKKRKGLPVSSQKDEAGVMRYRIGQGTQ